MKRIYPISVSQILQRRKNEGGMQQNRVAPTTNSLHRKQSKVSDTHNVVDKLIKAATEQQMLTSELKHEIFNVVGSKTGINLNRNLFSTNVTLEAHKDVKEIQRYSVKSVKSYFVLQGTVLKYQLKPGKACTAKKSKITEGQISSYLSQAQFERAHEQYQLQEQFGVFRGIGLCFKAEKDVRKCLIVGVDAVVICLRNLQNQMESFVNDGISQEEKLTILNRFAVLQSLGKRVQHLVDKFKLKVYTRKQEVYHFGEAPRSMYFILSGQIGFESRIPLSDKRVNTETLSAGNYFGEEEMLERVHRLQTATCISSQSQMLELPREIFEKMNEYSSFHECILKSAKEKMSQREMKLQKAQEVVNKMSRDQEVQPSKNSVKMMHGNAIRVLPVQDDAEIQFSMLQANPDMYQAVLKKFRKYNMKARQKNKPEVNWDIKRVWKVLHLNDILRDDAEMHSQEGRQFYDSHKRYLNQINETKSLRPKTSSSTYRTKLQYIAYLQQFN